MKPVVTIIILVGVSLILIASFFKKTQTTQENQIKSSHIGQLQISSPAFKNNHQLAKKYTCQGENINPPLLIQNVPQNTKSLILIVDDPDAPGGTWNHWLVYNINPKVKKINSDSIPRGGKELINSFGKRGYGGPCPPAGPAHHYFFKLYALDSLLPPTIKTKKQLLALAKSHLIAKGEIVALYQRQ